MLYYLGRISNSKTVVFTIIDTSPHSSPRFPPLPWCSDSLNRMWALVECSSGAHSTTGTLDHGASILLRFPLLTCHGQSFRELSTEEYEDVAIWLWIPALALMDMAIAATALHLLVSDLSRSSSARLPNPDCIGMAFSRVDRCTFLYFGQWHVMEPFNTWPNSRLHSRKPHLSLGLVGGCDDSRLLTNSIHD